jgi:hypothetical protein
MRSGSEVSVHVTVPHVIAGIAVPVNAEIKFDDRTGTLVSCTMGYRTIPFENGVWRHDLARGGRAPSGRHEDGPLASDRTIHGYLFRAGTLVEHWTDPPYDEMMVVLAAPHEIAGFTLPALAEIVFEEDGAILCCVIDGRRIPFENGAWRHDLAEDGC